MLIKPEKYGFSPTAWDRNRIEALKDPHAFLPFCLLQAVADKYACVIVIHGLGGQEVHVRPTQEAPESEVHLKCLGGIHFNYYIPQAWVWDVVMGNNNPTDCASQSSTGGYVKYNQNVIALPIVRVISP